MKKIIVTAIALVAMALLLGQTVDTSAPPAGFEGVTEMVDHEVFELTLKALQPDITTFKEKADTYNQVGRYNFPKYYLELIQKVSKMQLDNWQQQRNKWLEESK